MSQESEGEEEEFQNHFPVLFKEITEGKENFMEEEIRTSTGSKKVRKFLGYTPGVIDFICRCSTVEEALEIITYMLLKGDISENHAKQLRKQLQEKGLEFFGEHRPPGYYEKV
ncbi:MAG: DUF2095 domain-containing protein [Candidatus Heimdallarchaeota archaeon]|nr:DUF2095 domain-containing protein [Candidatus Heimdallarchaeota archaeon]